MPEVKDYDSEEKPQETKSLYHVNARNFLYPSSYTIRFPVPDEKVPWEVEFQIYQPPFFTADRKDKAACDPLGQNPRGRTGLRGRGSLCYFGPNHAMHPVVTRWRRNTDGLIYRKNLKKMLEVLVVLFPLSDHWALPGGSLEPGESLPLKLKHVLRREFWTQFQNLLNQGTEIYKGYIDDPRNTDNAWIETVAVNVHFEDKNDIEMKRMNSFLQGLDPEVCIRWQVVDKRIPLYANHKELLQKASALLGAYY
uniref:Transient receptor potential cation channel subfamily M member 2 n=1 Tax=Crocodylus porosus TaxID=8502 RepID=A0A7M4EAT9_CROPO